MERSYQDISVVLSQLDMVLLVRQTRDRFLVPGSQPAWWHEYAGTRDDDEIFVVGERHPFLANFLVDADRFWSAKQPGCCDSGVWEPSFAESQHLLEAYAIRLGDDDLLIIEDLRSTRSNQSKLIRAGRNTQLELLKDIAQRQQLEMKLRHARDAAIQLEHAKGQLLANTSHELRTPLSALLGMLEMVIETTDDPTENLQSAYDAAKRLQRIVHDLLDFAALDAGRPTLELSSFSPAELLAEIGRDFQPAAAEKGLELVVATPTPRHPTKLSQRSITSDRIRLRQILNNLVDNAIRYTDQGRITLTLIVDDPEATQFVVADTGRGIHPQDQQLIFDAFRRGSSSHVDDGGTGLGLAIASELVELLEGELRLESIPATGTTFTIQLPTQLQAVAQDDSRQATDPRVAKPSVPADMPAGLRVLVAEDNPANRRYLVHVLKSFKIDVDEVDNGVDLIDRAFSRGYDLILTDCRMSGLGGLEASTQIRQREQDTGQRVPIIAVTAHTARLDAEPFLSSGVDDILIKPFTRAELFEKIVSLVQRRDAFATE